MKQQQQQQQHQIKNRQRRTGYSEKPQTPPPSLATLPTIAIPIGSIRFSMLVLMAVPDNDYDGDNPIIVLDDDSPKRGFFSIFYFVRSCFWEEGKGVFGPGSIPRHSA